MKTDIPHDDLVHLEKHRDEARKYLPAITDVDRKQEAVTQTGPYFDKWFDIALGRGFVAVLILAWFS